jgi:hypothetical protein
MANRAPKWRRSVVEKQQTELTDRSKAVRMSSESASNAINRVIRNANSYFAWRSEIQVISPRLRLVR